MSKVLVLYYSSYGHIETMANAVAEGAREAGAAVDIKRVPELVPADVLGKLPNLQYFASVSGGRIVKGRFPILDPGAGVDVAQARSVA